MQATGTRSPEFLCQVFSYSADEKWIKLNWINKTQATILIDKPYEGQGTNDYPNLKEGSWTGTLIDVKLEIEFQPFFLFNLAIFKVKNIYIKMGSLVQTQNLKSN